MGDSKQLSKQIPAGQTVQRISAQCDKSSHTQRHILGLLGFKLKIQHREVGRQKLFSPSFPKAKSPVAKSVTLSSPGWRQIDSDGDGERFPNGSVHSKHICPRVLSIASGKYNRHFRMDLPTGHTILEGLPGGSYYNAKAVLDLEGWGYAWHNFAQPDLNTSTSLTKGISRIPQEFPLAL